MSWQHLNNAVRGTVIACVYFDPERGMVKAATVYLGKCIEVELEINASDPDGDLDRLFDELDKKIQEVRDNDTPIEGSGIVYYG